MNYENAADVLSRITALKYDHMVRRVGQEIVMKFVDASNLSDEQILGADADTFDAWVNSDPADDPDSERYDSASKAFVDSVTELFDNVDGYVLQDVTETGLTLRSVVDIQGSLAAAVFLRTSMLHGHVVTTKTLQVIGGEHAGHTPLDITAADEDTVEMALEHLQSVNDTLSQ